MLSDVSELPRWARWLFSSLPIGRLLGIPVRVHVLTVAIPILIAPWFERFGAVEQWVWAVGATAGLYAITLGHELAHALAGRRYHIRTDRIVLHPLGGFAHLQSPPPHPRADVFIALAGPASHLPWLLLLFAIQRLGPDLGPRLELALSMAWTLNLSLFLFNLLPFFPLDGGRALRGLLAMRWHPNLASRVSAQIGIVGAVGLVVYGFVTHGTPGILIVMIAVNMVLTALQEISAARFGPGPYGEPREPWEQDPEAWKHGPVRDVREEARPREERRRARRSTTSETPRPRATPVGPELDLLLARVGEVGMAGLTEAERTALEEASRRLRSDRPHSR